MARTQLASRFLTVLVVAGAFVTGLLAQEPQVEGGGNYTEITMTADEAFLDLRVDVAGAAVRLSALLEARGESVPGGVLPERWFQVGDAWIRLEPLPYLPGDWSRMRVRVGTFQTDAERDLAADLLSELAFQLDLERGELPREADEVMDDGVVETEVFETQQSIQGGYRFGGARVIDSQVEVLSDDVAQQPLQLYVPLPIEVKSVGYADGYDDGYRDAYQRPRYSFYGGYASPYAYCSPWAFSCLSYNWWSYGYRFGWHSYSSYYAWCSPYSGWGWHPYGLWWGDSHTINCACSLCISADHYADAHDHDCDQSDDHDGHDGGGDPPGDDHGEGGPGNHGSGLLARDLETGALPESAAPIATHASPGVVSFEPRSSVLDSTSGPALREIKGMPGESQAATPPSADTGVSSSSGDDLFADGAGGAALPGETATDVGSDFGGGAHPTGAGSASDDEDEESDEVVTRSPPDSPPKMGRIAWAPTVRTVTARTVRVGSRGVSEGTRPSVRTSVPTRHSVDLGRNWDPAVIMRSSDTMSVVSGRSSGSTPPIRVSTPKVVSRSVNGLSRGSSSRTVTSLTSHGSLRSATPSWSGSSGRSVETSIGSSRTSTPIRPTSVIGTSFSPSLPAFNRAAPVPSRGTSLKSPQASSSRSSGTKRSSGKKRSSRKKRSSDSQSSAGVTRSGVRSNSKRDR